MEGTRKGLKTNCFQCGEDCTGHHIIEKDKDGNDVAICSVNCSMEFHESEYWQIEDKSYKYYHD